MAKASRSESLEIRAHLAALKKDPKECDKLYAAAINLTTDYTGTAVRYLTVLAKSLRTEKLYEVFSVVRESLKGNPEATRFVERLLAIEGFLVTAHSLGDDLKTMGTYGGAELVPAEEQVTQWTDFSDCEDRDFVEPVAFAKSSWKVKTSGH